MIKIDVFIQNKNWKKYISNPSRYINNKINLINSSIKFIKKKKKKLFYIISVKQTDKKIKKKI